MYRVFFKRVLDVIFSIFFLLLFIVLFIPIYLATKLEDKGPVFYRAERLGKNKQVFKIYKFRSMKVNAPDIRNVDGSAFNSKNDFRVTKIGRILRETSIDEVPQIINVLKGDMSIIGPRPGLPDLLSIYEADEIDKLKVRPGITGLTQAYYRNGLSSREKRLKDAWYANNVSLFLDIKIFFKTIGTVLKRESLYTSDGITNKQNNKTTS